MYLYCFPRLRQNVPTAAAHCGQTWTSSFMVKNVGGFHFVSMFFTCRRTCSLWPLPPLNVHHIRWTVWTGKNIKTKPQLQLLHCFTLLTPGPGPEPEPNRTTAVPAGERTHPRKQHFVSQDFTGLPCLTHACHLTFSLCLSKSSIYSSNCDVVLFYLSSIVGNKGKRVGGRKKNKVNNTISRL